MTEEKVDWRWIQQRQLESNPDLPMLTCPLCSGQVSEDVSSLHVQEEHPAFYKEFRSKVDSAWREQMGDYPQ